MVDTYFRHLPETVVPGKRLGRHVRHDPRSLAYKVEPDGTAKTVRWERKTPILDQGDLGSCTGNATCGCLGTEVFYSTLLDQLNAGRLHLDEDEAVALYSTATKLDPYRGTYPPTDTGSDGLSVAKAAKAANLISGYRHITSLAAAKTAIQSGPFITGTAWLTGMDEPDENGLVYASGSERGGHEYEVIGFDVEQDLWEFANSWGTSFGKDGYFFMSSTDYAALLKNDGDATVLVPITQPAPTPTPPAPSNDLVTQIEAKLQELLDWIKGKLG